jgi:hypothetical protein
MIWTAMETHKTAVHENDHRLNRSKVKATESLTSAVAGHHRNMAPKRTLIAFVWFSGDT